MKPLHELLQEGASFKQLLKYLPAILVVQIILTLLGYEVVTGSPELFLKNNGYALNILLAVEGLRNYLRYNLVLYPISEEIQFRLIPFMMVFVGLKLMRLEGRAVGMWILMATLLVTSVVFGFGHGGIRCIFMQGTSGVVYGLVFLKCSVLTHRRYRDHFRNTAKGLCASTLVHSSFNCSMLCIAACAGLIYR